MVRSHEEGMADGAGGRPLDFAYSQEAERLHTGPHFSFPFLFLFSLVPHPVPEAAPPARTCAYTHTDTHTVCDFPLQFSQLK